MFTIRFSKMSQMLNLCNVFACITGINLLQGNFYKLKLSLMLAVKILHFLRGMIAKLYLSNLTYIPLCF